MSTATAPGVTSRPLAEDCERLFREHYQLIYRTALRVTGSSEDAEDVLQTIFLRLLRREYAPDLKTNPKAYLYRAAVNLSLDTVRARQRQIVTADGDRFVSPAPNATNPEEEMHER